jgi:hypothetical protein
VPIFPGADISDNRASTDQRVSASTYSNTALAPMSDCSKARSVPPMTEPHDSRFPLGSTSLMLGAALTIAGGLYKEITYLTGHVPDHLYRAPFSHGMFLVLAIYAAATHVLILTGVVDLRGRLARGGASRGTTAGLAYVTAATGLLFVCELLTIPLVDKTDGATGSSVVDGLFGLATVGGAAGLITAGSALLRGRSCSPRIAWAVLWCGILSVIAIPMEFSDAIAGFAIAVYGLGYAVLAASVHRDLGRFTKQRARSDVRRSTDTGLVSG